MAEFQEVMKQLNRMCKAHPYCEDDECPVQATGCCGNIGAHCSEALQAERIEKTVMTWATEHPEPVYPTWGEWLAEKYDFDLREIMYTPIPADIAEKLGVQPK